MIKVLWCLWPKIIWRAHLPISRVRYLNNLNYNWHIFSPKTLPFLEKLSEPKMEAQGGIRDWLRLHQVSTAISFLGPFWAEEEKALPVFVFVPLFIFLVQSLGFSCSASLREHGRPGLCKCRKDSEGWSSIYLLPKSFFSINNTERRGGSFTWRQGRWTSRMGEKDRAKCSLVLLGQRHQRRGGDCYSNQNQNRRRRTKSQLRRGRGEVSIQNCRTDHCTDIFHFHLTNSNSTSIIFRLFGLTLAQTLSGPKGAWTKETWCSWRLF